nr:MAG TPA: hypothetical protein [Bacteriophage sp.]
MKVRASYVSFTSQGNIVEAHIRLSSFLSA